MRVSHIWIKVSSDSSSCYIFKYRPLKLTVSLPSDFVVWLASPEAAFLKRKYVWANWDVGEMISRKEEITSSELLTIKLAGWPFETPESERGEYYIKLDE